MAPTLRDVAAHVCHAHDAAKGVPMHGPCCSKANRHECLSYSVTYSVTYIVTWERLALCCDLCSTGRVL